MRRLLMAFRLRRLQALDFLHELRSILLPRLPLRLKHGPSIWFNMDPSTDSPVYLGKYI